MGETLNAESALNYGLISTIVTNEVESSALEVSQKIASLSHQVIINYYHSLYDSFRRQ
jgi:enoyl-CoA hydratase/carnithine racemase